MEVRPEGVIISANNSPGIFYGMQTLIQLLPLSPFVMTDHGPAISPGTSAASGPLNAAGVAAGEAGMAGSGATAGARGGFAIPTAHGPLPLFRPTRRILCLCDSLDEPAVLEFANSKIPIRQTVKAVEHFSLEHFRAALTSLAMSKIGRVFTLLLFADGLVGSLNVWSVRGQNTCQVPRVA